ncbi:unnamed protein product [Linum tenue]|uniref:Aldehyde dehydrogenase domain-containing protein n=1 Tax=Linum tenue TaxID=586396 RepID=A0AAV0S819_9ROSI|nr:unnamed protein product [Linum tenue]
MANHGSNGSSDDLTFPLEIPPAKIRFTKLFIGGEFVDSVSGKTFETIDPRTGETIARVSEGDKEDIDLAVGAARRAFDHGPWPRLPGAARAKIMHKFADLIDQHIEELATLDTLNAGKLFSWGKAVDIPSVANTLRYFAGAADKIHGQVLKMSRELHAYTLLEPIGVVGLIIPWNFPSTMFFVKVSPALAAGCTMVVKPAEQTPLSALFYAHLAKEVSFTGSTEVGRKVMQAAAASNLKTVSLELGGKSPLLIFDDADIDQAADLALLGVMHNKGEVCVAGSRVLVQEAIYDEFVKTLVEKAKEWVVGDPFHPNSRVGPQVDKKQYEKVMSYIEHGKREGATLLTGGKPAAKARGRVLSKFADLIDQNADELAGLESIDAGKLFTFNKMADIPFAANLLRYYAGAADKIHGDVLKMSRELHGYTLLEPIGVVGHIIPWNFPCTLFFSKVAPSLAAGCTMVVKPAEQTPLSALEAGIPDGVMNVVVGYGATAGAAISAHMDVDKVSFTGSTEVGRKVMQAAALSNLKPVSLELGGKSPVLIFDDADVDKAVDLALLAIFYNKGEVCAAGSRVFVQEGIYDEFVKKLAVKAKEWTVGDPLDPTTRVGPQVNKTQFERVLSYIEHGKREGATLLTGGKPAAETGFYIQPTVFTDVKEDMMISRDEIFGPVMALMKFKTIEEGIKYANNTKYGLASGIVTKSLDIANTVSRSIKAGVVWINCYHGFDIDCPFGGYKMSGFGKDFGMEALHKYLQTKAVVTPIYNSPWL